MSKNKIHYDQPRSTKINPDQTSSTKIKNINQNQQRSWVSRELVINHKLFFLMHQTNLFGSRKPKKHGLFSLLTPYFIFVLLWHSLRSIKINHGE